MKYAGIDIGSTTTKVVILEEEEVISSRVGPTGPRPGVTAGEMYHRALSERELSADDIEVVAATGYGRRLTDLADLVLTEIRACALGVTAVDRGPLAVRTIIDLGGQDTKVIALGENAEVADFSMNDKCAAGTGRFLEMLAHKLDLDYEAFVEEALKSETTLQMNATCAVFAESEVVGLLARDFSKADIAAAAHNAIAFRVAAMTRRVGQEGPFGFVGGGARNRALVRALSRQLGQEVRVMPDAQAVVALGAAVGGRRRLAKMGGKDGEGG